MSLWECRLKRKHVQTCVTEENGAGHAYAYSLKKESREAKCKTSFQEVNNY
ncbi:MAG: hypothetical protein KAH01_07925 [Caldisericia bacterium]|nr:hypothetical protein [Caldisericia bacterium]